MSRGTPDSLALGFMVFGHKGSNQAGGKQASCAGVELLDPIGKAASRRFDRTLRRFKPTGYTPLGAALRKARGAFAGEEDSMNRIILVTDGVDTCGGNPVAEARRLKQAGIKVTTDVVGFDVAKPDEARRLRAIAEASGGTYTDARSADALEDYFAAELERVDDLAANYLCVTENAAKVSLCQEETAAKGSLYMDRAAADASAAGRDAQAGEIERLTKRLDEAAEQREEAFDRQSEATADRLEREYEEADRRLERLNR
jgi:von Willebrand factor type A domain